MNDARAIPIVAVIPTRDHAETLCLDLIEQLERDGAVERIIVLDNRDEPEHFTASGGGYFNQEIIDWRPAPGLTITQLWNLGWYEATQWASGCRVNVAILNDDIVIGDSPYMETLADRLRDEHDLWLVCPDYHLSIEDQRYTPGGVTDVGPTETVRGTYRQGGWCGWAFMIRGELLGEPLEPIDENLIHWAGDDHLDWQIRHHGGRCAVVKGLPLDHLGSATARLHPETHEQGWKDLAYFEEKYK